MLTKLRLKLKQRWLPYIYGKIGKSCLRILAATCRFKFEGLESFLKAAEDQKCVLVFWHNRLCMIAAIMERCAPQFQYAAVISNSRDGEMIAVLTNSYRQARSIRVPHNSRSAALQTITRELKKNKEILVITPDGPRGPLYKVKQGVVVAAREASAHVVPLSWSASNCWRLKTWDGFMIPKPFSTIKVKIGESFQISKDSVSIQEGQEILEQALCRLMD